MILAILKAQLLSMRMRPGMRRASALFGSITGLIFYGFFAFVGWMAMLFFSLGNQKPLFIPVLSIVLPFVMLYWQLSPVIAASFGASLDLAKLRVYPIPNRTLFVVEVMLRVATCSEMLILVAGVTAGLLRNPAMGWKASPFILSGAAIFTGMNVLVSAGTRSWLERLILRTRLRELLMALLVLASIAPQILLATHVNKSALLSLSPSQMIWPWAAVAHLMIRDSVGWAALSGVLWLTVSVAFSRWQFERTLRYDGSAVRRVDREARPDAFMERIYRFPGSLLPDPLAALVEKELRSLSRIARFRLVYAMSCFFGLVIYMPSMRRGQHNFFTENALPIMALYGLLMLGQISYWNSFGFDRSAVQGYFSWPVKLRDVLIAKNLTVLVLLLPQILVISVVCRFAKMPTGVGKMLETVVVIAIAAAYWFAVGNICSVRIPRALDPDKMGQMSNKMQTLTILATPLLLLPIGLAYWSRWFFESQIVFVGIMVVAAILGGIFYWVGLESAVEAAAEKREKMLLELSRSDGPLSIA